MSCTRKNRENRKGMREAVSKMAALRKIQVVVNPMSTMKEGK